MFDKLIEECIENVEEAKLAKITLTENENNHGYSSFTLDVVLFSVVFTIIIGIATYFVYCKYLNLNKENVSRYNHVHQAPDF